jgi:hypothetical protein
MHNTAPLANMGRRFPADATGGLGTTQPVGPWHNRRRDETGQKNVAPDHHRMSRRAVLQEDEEQPGLCWVLTALERCTETESSLYCKPDRRDSTAVHPVPH